jgi:hypothetical protein
MPIDTGIYANLLRPPKSVADYDNEAVQSQTNALQLQQLRQGVSDQNALRQATMQFGADSGQNLQALQKAGAFKQAQDYQKAIYDNQKTQSGINLDTAHADNFKGKTADDTFGLQTKKRGTALKDIAGLNSPEDALAGINRHLQLGDIDEQKAAMLRQSIPQNPADFPRWQIGMLRNIMTAHEQIAAQQVDAAKAEQTRQFGVTSGETGRHNLRTEAVASGQLGVAQGQLGVARDRLATEKAAPKGQYDAERGVLVDPRTGLATPVTMGGQPLPPKDKPLTETQGKATTFVSRMQDSERVIKELEKKGVSGSDLRTMAAGSFYTNWLASDEGQQYRQAQENWVTANLRQESGAAIGKNEMEKDVRKFFPTPGDGPEVIKQKANSRAIATRGMLAQAGPGAKQVSAIVGGGSTSRTVTRTGTDANGKKVVQYSDGSIEHAD